MLDNLSRLRTGRTKRVSSWDTSGGNADAWTIPPGETMEIAGMIANNHRGSVTGIKELLLRGLGADLRQQYDNEIDYARNVMRGAKAEDAFPEFIARKGRAL